VQTPSSPSPESNPELRDVTRRFWAALALSFPMFAIEFATHLMDMHLPLAQQTSNWLELTLGTPVVFWAGWPFFVKAIEAVKARSVSMFQLTAVRTGAAWIYSVLGTAFPSLFPASLRAADGSVIVCFHAAAVITLLVLLGQLLDQRAKAKKAATGQSCARTGDSNRAVCCC
jgi:Cu+-exporting ATPase